MVFVIYCGRSSPDSIRSFSFAWAISRPTIMVPVSDRCESRPQIAIAGRGSFLHRTVEIDSPRRAPPAWTVARAAAGGICYWPGLCSSFSIQMPSRLIFAFDGRPSRRDAHPHRDRKRAVTRHGRITRISWAKYFRRIRGAEAKFFFCAFFQQFLFQWRSRNALAVLATSSAVGSARRK